MKKRRIAIFCFLALLTTVSAFAGGASQSPGAAPLKDGAPFPDLALTGELSPEQAKDLGLAGKTPPYSLNQIAAPTLIVEIYSMYCPFCQAEAPVMNGLNQLLKERKLADKIKIIGLAAGNSDFEVGVFRDKYGVTFPLFSDMDFTAHKAAGEVGTPFFYVLRKQPAGDYTIIFSSLGRMDSPEQFLKDVLAKAQP